MAFLKISGTHPVQLRDLLITSVRETALESRPCFSMAGKTLSEPGDLLVFVALSSVVMCATVTGRKWDSRAAVVGCWLAGCKHNDCRLGSCTMLANVSVRLLRDAIG